MTAMSQKCSCRTPWLYFSLSQNVWGINSAETPSPNTKAAGTNISHPSGTQLIKSSRDLPVLENMVQVKGNVCHPLKPVYSSLTGHVAFGIIYAWTTTPNTLHRMEFSYCNFTENSYLILFSSCNQKHNQIVGKLQMCPASIISIKLNTCDCGITLYHLWLLSICNTCDCVISL